MINPNVIKRLTTGLLLGTVFFMLFFFFPAWVLTVLLWCTLFVVLGTEWPYLGFFYAAPIYPILPFVFLTELNKVPEYRPLVLFVFAFSFFFDSASYATGKLFGKHKLIPKISPNKTWEGFIGGTVSSYGFAYFLFKIFKLKFTWSLFIPFIGIASICALTGDLFISALKRHSGLKDTGTILPGHGGILDRYDSILFVGVLVYACKHLLI